MTHALGCCTLAWTMLTAWPAAAEPGATLSFGVFPRWNAQLTVRDFSPLAAVMGQRLGQTVRIETDKSFDAFMRRVEAGEFDLIHLNPLQYLTASRQAGYRAVAKVCENRECTIRAMIVTRKDSDVTRVQDLRGRTVAFGDPGAFVSFVVGSSILREAGLKPQDYRSIFTKNPPNALLAVYNGEADAAGVGSSIYERPELRRRVDMSQLRILAQSAPLPGLPIAVRDRLGTGLAERVRKVLIELPGLQGGPQALRAIGANRFEEVDDAAYAAFLPLAAEPDDAR